MLTYAQVVEALGLLVRARQQQPHEARMLVAYGNALRHR
jgi:hypothetical protein